MIPLGVAAGRVKRPNDIDGLLDVPSDILSFVTLGSYTPLPRDGNPGNVYHRETNGTTLNALGLPNPGIEEALRSLPSMIRRLHESGKRARVSIAGFGVEDFVSMAKKLAQLDIDQIELNLGCPNVRDGGSQKPIFAFDAKLVRDIVDAVYYACGTGFAVKVSPYSDPRVLTYIADAIVFSEREVGAIVTTNTFPNGLAFKDDTFAITTNDGYAGVAGTALHEIALGQVRQWKIYLEQIIDATHKPVVHGVGGINSGRALRNFELAGAVEAQVGSAYFDAEDPRVFQRIVEEYVQFCEPE